MGQVFVRASRRAKAYVRGGVNRKGAKRIKKAYKAIDKTYDVRPTYSAGKIYSQSYHARTVQLKKRRHKLYHFARQLK